MFRKQKTLTSESGLTLIELLISIAIITLVAGVCVNLIAGSLESWRYTGDRVELLNTAQVAMERMVSKTRNTTWVLLPLRISNPNNPNYPNVDYYPESRLAVSGGVDNDGDGLVDEDPGKDITGDGMAGIMGIDDNNDGLIDNGSADNDDEQGVHDEDELDGLDNDDDKRVDEDPKENFFGGNNDDDLDGTKNEDPFDPVIYYLTGTTLLERQNVLNATVADNIIAENVSQFRVLRRRVNGNTLIDIYLKLDNGKHSVELTTTVLAQGMFKP